MKKALIISIVAAASASSFSQTIYDNVTATKVWEGAIGTKASTGLGLTEDNSYSNVTNFSGFAASQGGSTSTAGVITTRMLADDLLTVNPGGTSIEGFTFSVVNFNTTALSARALVRFYADNAGTPGNFLSGFNFNLISFTAGSVATFNFSTANAVIIPTGGKLWAAISFDNTGATTSTTAQMDNLGQGLFTPPTVGTSADTDFLTTASGGFVVNNPTGTVRTSPFSNAPAANYGWALRAVPEPTSVAVLGLGLFGLVARRRRSSK